ncbi:MAG: MaoC family dehydratase [Deltaproteobacteria bacterium]|nr:MaoC family dehydratase [Deltaproteobacteria bacterium]
MKTQIVRTFSEIEIGDELGPMTRTPTTAMVQRYAEAVDIKELRFFFDPEEARKNGLQHPIVPGPMTAGFMTQLLKDSFPGWRLQSMSTTFRTPALHGELLSIWGNVTEKDEQDSLCTVHCDIVVENPRGDRVAVGTARLSRSSNL